ncbi:hypothetical protein BRC83_02510 [Halobacteriales archaeon QS_1_68_17]|nr:MAG: hypothetical protein BRC83_02510 [Halobacteriales archaeon QS_1_68_17]
MDYRELDAGGDCLARLPGVDRGERSERVVDVLVPGTGRDAERDGPGQSAGHPDGETTSAGRRDGREFDERGRRGPETDRDRRPFT